MASGHPIAADAGLTALQNGGSAVDAALTAAITQWVVNAPQCGPGGELMALVADHDNITVYGGWSRAPVAITSLGEFNQHRLTGPRNAAVPGALRGAETAWNAHGQRSWSDLFAGALEAAAGHQVNERMADVYKQVHNKGHGEALQRIIGHRNPPSAGTEIAMVTLAHTLELVAAEGADAFYDGPLAAKLVSAAQRDGAGLRHGDLAAMKATVKPAERFEIDDINIWVPGYPSQAPIVAALLAEVSPQADPALRPFATTMAPKVQQQLVDFCKDGLGSRDGTAVSTAVDSQGVSATVVHSLAETKFGTGWVADDTGVAFSNRAGTALSTRPDLPAANPQGGKVLPHTLSAAHVRKRHAPDWLTVSTPGGDRQVQWLAQAIQRFRRNAALSEIVGGPRWFVCPVGDRFGVPVGIGKPWYAYAEPDIEWHNDTRLAGFEVRQTNNVGGGLQAAVKMGDKITLGSDPRAAGAALSLRSLRDQEILNA